MNPCSLSKKLRSSYFAGRRTLDSAQISVKMNHWIYLEKTEREVVEDCLRLLDTGTSDYVIYDEATRSYRPTETIEFKHLSAPGLRQDLQALCDYQTGVKQILADIRNYESFPSSVFRSISSVISGYMNKVKQEISNVIILFNIQNGK